MDNPAGGSFFFRSSQPNTYTLMNARCTMISSVNLPTALIGLVALSLTSSKSFLANRQDSTRQFCLFQF
jgi:hypothetical protein